MPNYMLVYKGEATDMDDMTPDQQQEIMAKWGAWMGRVGRSMVDIGTPFGPGASVVDDGSAGTATPLSGYSIVQADSLDDAKSLVGGHPYLSDGTGDYAVDIYEMMPTPEM